MSDTTVEVNYRGKTLKLAGQPATKEQSVCILRFNQLKILHERALSALKAQEQIVEHFNKEAEALQPIVNKILYTELGYDPTKHTDTVLHTDDAGNVTVAFIPKKLERKPDKVIQHKDPAHANRQGDNLQVASRPSGV